MDANIKDHILVHVRDSMIEQSSSDTYDKKYQFKVLAEYHGGYIIHIPNNIQIIGRWELTQLEIDKYQIPYFYKGDNAYFLTYAQMVKVFKQCEFDGMFCMRCKEFYPMAEANRDDGNLMCYLCRFNRFR